MPDEKNMNTSTVTATVNELNQSFSIKEGDHHVYFETGDGDIPVMKIQNNQARALISLQGAHLLSWIPNGQEEVIWVSEDATFLPGKSVRGGIPICWPWFGPHEENTAYPAHGFARTVHWQVTEVQSLPTGETQVIYTLATDQLAQNLRQMWPKSTQAEYRLTIGSFLEMDLTTINNSEQNMTIGQALHTYFNIEGVTSTKVLGLEGKDYIDKTDSFKRKTQTGPVTISEETDRVYLETPDDLVLDDQKRKITIKKQGSKSTVIWNPWKEMAEKMGDLGPDGYLKMLCVESANAMDDVIEIKPGGHHSLRVRYEVDNAV